MKQAKDMSAAERAAALEQIKLEGRKLEPKPQPMPTDKRAADMTVQERAEWLAEHKRRFA